MPCRVDVCGKCGEYDCPAFTPGTTCKYPVGKSKAVAEALDKYDLKGALCDVLSLIEDSGAIALLNKVDRKTLAWWKRHQQNEVDKIKKQALAKLTNKEKRALGLK